jgi:hypothetical protein
VSNIKIGRNEEVFIEDEMKGFVPYVIELVFEGSVGHLSPLVKAWMVIFSYFSS